MMICTIDIEPKKGAKQTLRFDVSQLHSWPDMEGFGSSFRWRNYGGIWSGYGKPATGLDSEYICYLLADGANDSSGSRLNHAGYEGNGGTFALRGKDLGELAISLSGQSFKYGFYVSSVVVRGFEKPTDGERFFIEDKIAPSLGAFVEANKAQLLSEAVDRVEACLQDRLAGARESINTLSDEAEEAIARLRKGAQS